MAWGNAGDLTLGVKLSDLPAVLFLFHYSSSRPQPKN